MAVFVIDASATLPWCFEDETTQWTERLLERLRGGDRAVTAAHWPTEVSNGMWVAVRRQRIAREKLSLFWNALTALPIEVEAPLSVNETPSIFALCERHQLTVYDATYLELAIRKVLPLATLDEALVRAAALEAVPLVS